VIKDIVFKGSALELRLDVDGIELISRRSLERRPICVGEEMNVIIYRLFAMKGSKAVLMQNSDLVSLDPDGRKLEKYLYGEGGYFVG
jgi:sulfate transport system ATP-binding protein